ncbi:MAG: chromate transporter, partial [Chloroflexi bacterium]
MAVAAASLVAIAIVGLPFPVVIGAAALIGLTSGRIATNRSLMVSGSGA